LISFVSGSQSSEQLEEEILVSLTELSERAELALIESMLSGEVDSNSAYLEFHPRRRRNRESGLGANAITNVFKVGRKQRI
jgi:hypothetical protein